jgi:TalC/MipB family fructose-6-phosphate aldolase
MKLIIDYAGIETIKNIFEYYPVDGVTTNPSILAANGKPPYETLKEIRKFIGDERELHVQVISAECSGMLIEAEHICSELGAKTFIKIPVTREGLRAISLLSKKEYHVTATAIYSPMQAFLAAKSGASYAAPYVNRIDNLGYNGIQTTIDIQNIYRNNFLKTKVLAASFKNSQQLLELCKYGIDASTVSPDVIEGLIKNDSVSAAVKAFSNNFEKLCGEGKTMADCD